jgi:choline dehydrogenase
VTTDAEILTYLSGAFTPTWHATGTCRMGKPSDTTAIVDTRARVYGVKGLRVVDASSFPFLLPGHMQATVYALAEKIVEDVLEH